MAPPQLMTYAELAEVWGVSKEAARKKVEGLRLPRQTGNDGRARVMVDLTEVQHEPMKPKASDRRPPADRPEDMADVRRYISPLETQLPGHPSLGPSVRAAFERERDRADGLTADLVA